MGSQSSNAFAPKAWQPITPAGVASFASATLSRLIVCQVIFASLSGLAIAWVLAHAVFPSVRTAIDRLPESGEIRSGVLFWPGASPLLLSEGRVLAMSVDLEHQGSIRVPADVFLEFGERTIRAYSIAGFSEWRYPSDWLVLANRPDLVPWWGAWKAPILGLSFLGTVAVLLCAWAVEASICFGPAWLLAFFGNRLLSPVEAWRMSGAAMMPAGLILCAGIMAYGTGLLNLIGLLLLIGAALVAGGVYIVLAVFKLPRDPGAAQQSANPFAKSGQA